VFELLEATLVRCAAIGALRFEPRVAARLILSASVGNALDHIASPELFDDPATSNRMREAVFAHVLTGTSTREDADPLREAALRLRAQLDLVGTEALEPVETALLRRWLDRITGAGSVR
jgi:hypothetical protein